MQNTAGIIPNPETFLVLLACAVLCAALYIITAKLNLPRRRSLLFIILAGYTLISFSKLGSFSFPSTTWQPSVQDQSFVIILPEDTHFDAVYTIYGEGDNNALSEGYQLGFNGLYIYGSDNRTDWEVISEPDDTRIYRYRIEEGDWDYRYILVYSVNTLDTLSELGLRAYGEERFLPLQIEADPYADSAYPASLVIDEQDCLALHPTYEDQSFFDEVYHVRNAWEIQAGQRMYSHVHPLTGTQLIALSVSVFGMNPFAWRLPGAVCGVLILLAVYFILETMMPDTDVPVLGTFFLSIDFMHMTTSRIATLEPFSILFILCMYLYMVRYICRDHAHTDRKILFRNLFLSGLFTGIAIATKWTGCYSAAGLAVIFFAGMYHDAKKMDGKDFRALYSAVIPFCVLVFIILPVLIYFLSYLPVPAFRDGWSVKNVLEQIRYIFHYHATLQAEHPYESKWYMWLLDIRPVWYYVDHYDGGVMRTIACFSNPVIALCGLPAVLYCIRQGFFRSDRNAALIAVGYLSALLPWLLVSRNTFAYHYYPASVFLCMALAYALKDHRRTAGCIAVISLFVFVLYLPVICGFAASETYLHLLELLPSWYWG